MLLLQSLMLILNPIAGPSGGVFSPWIAAWRRGSVLRPEGACPAQAQATATSRCATCRGLGGPEQGH
ncbi:hypothetical protein ABBQ38_004968 [Trebouxia sp. C0009 RCD-2024]